MVVLNCVLTPYPVVHILFKACQRLGHVSAEYPQGSSQGEGRGSRFASRLWGLGQLLPPFFSRGFPLLPLPAAHLLLSVWWSLLSAVPSSRLPSLQVPPQSAPFPPEILPLDSQSQADPSLSLVTPSWPSLLRCLPPRPARSPRAQKGHSIPLEFPELLRTWCLTRTEHRPIQ